MGRYFQTPVHMHVLDKAGSGARGREILYDPAYFERSAQALLDDLARAFAQRNPGARLLYISGAHADPGPLSPWVGAVVASLLVTWVTFVPCFVFIFLGAPYVERRDLEECVGLALGSPEFQRR